MQMITQQTIQRIKDTARITDVAGWYLTLHRSGKGFTALCPFHADRHPSFHLSPELNLGKCFSCGQAADPVGLVMHLEPCSYPEALRLLADKYQIPVEETISREDPEQSIREELLRANKAFAASLISECNGQEEDFTGQAATEEDRQKLKDVYRLFAVGLCPPNPPRAFKEYRNRLIFPLRSLSGQVIGLAGRRYPPLQGEAARADKTKYINSPDSPAYHKSRFLYGLHEAAKAIRSDGKVIIVEGYKDVIACHAAGLKHTVALSGTELTDEHIRLLSRFTRHILLSLDSDTAGRKAMRKAIRSLSAAGCRIEIALLPEGDDPDSYYRREGSEALASFYSQAFADFPGIALLPGNPLFPPLAQKGVNDPQTIHELSEIILLQPDGLKAYTDLQRLSQATGIPVEILQKEGEKPSPPLRPAPTCSSPPSPKASESPTVAGERQLLAFCLRHADDSFTDESGSIRLPAWIAGELERCGIPFVHAPHRELLALLAAGRPLHAVADEALSQLITTLQAEGWQEEDCPGASPESDDSNLSDATYHQFLLYQEPFVHRKLEETLQQLQASSSPSEQADRHLLLTQYFELSAEITRELGHMPIRLK